MGKNIIVGQSGGPTSVINASLAGVIKAAYNHGISKIYGMRNGVKGLLERRWVDLGSTVPNDIAIEILKRTPSSYLGSCRYKLPALEADGAEEIYSKIFAILNELEIGYFFYNGGNDSMDTIMKLCAYGEKVGSSIRFVGIPKTIDNDLAATDHSPGFGSAAKYIATTTKELILDAGVYPDKSVTILEVMGRNAGWLAASAALSRNDYSNGPDFIFLPELAFDFEIFMDKVRKTLEKKIMLCGYFRRD
jgi:6-phosphofructokinase 1